MKKILITGANSYIGTSFEQYIKENYSCEYEIDTVDMIDGTWREKSFAGYDAVFHVAGIAHQKQTKENAHLYYEVNRDLAVEVAKKAKAENVSQLVFLSTMSVYGKDTGIITKETEPNPKNSYGKSKLEAEISINELNGDGFKVSIVRPPMVYGLNCKGNFQTIAKIVKKLPVFPRIKNQRSLIYIDNLCEFVKLIIDEERQGTFLPQNMQLVSTVEMAKAIADKYNKKIYFSILLGISVFFLRPFSSTLRKAFGTLIYENTDDFKFSYSKVEKYESLVSSVDNQENI